MYLNFIPPTMTFLGVLFWDQFFTYTHKHIRTRELLIKTIVKIATFANDTALLTRYNYLIVAASDKLKVGLNDPEKWTRQ